MRSLRHARVSAVSALVVFAAGTVSGAVTITDSSAPLEPGVACFKVETPTATYYYDKAGAGLASMVDKSGTDWIKWSTATGASGVFRGIPNMGLGVFGHAGYTGATTTKVNSTTLRSTKSGGWDVTWEFFDTHAKMTINGIGGSYWLLYEGTPGGAFGSDDTCWRSNGQSNACNQRWNGDVTNTSGEAAGAEWVYFADGTLNRSIFLIHKDEGKCDTYYPMNPMTVFGFGRSEDRDPWIQLGSGNLPDVLVIGFVDARDYNTVGDYIDSIWSGGAPVVTEPGVTTKPASSVTAASARLNGEVTSTGGENPTVRIHWGDNDGGTGTWDDVEDLGPKGAGTFYADVTGLADGTTYYFRCYAENSAGGTWASSSESFTATAPVGGLVGHWKFDDGSGTTAADSSAKGNDGTIQGTATWTAGKVGSGALEFDGSSYVAIPNEADYDLADAVSYSVWIKVGASPVDWFGIVTKHDNMNLQREGGTNHLRWQTAGLSSVNLNGSADVLDGQWHHVVCTYDGSTKVLYVDNTGDASGSATGSIDTTDTPVEIGRNGLWTDLEFIGVMDDVRIYDYALTAGEVQTLYEMGGGGPTGPTITTQPQDVAVTTGAPAQFMVTATGSGTLSYQWHEDGSAISGATSATYTISSTTLAQNGHKFHCVVTDSAGSATSNQATLTVSEPMVDTDSDGLPDAWETQYGLNPATEDTDGDGTLDPNEDPDGDGRTNLQEYQNGTDPNVSDESGDGGCIGGGPGAAGPATGLLLAVIYALAFGTPRRGSKVL